MDRGLIWHTIFIGKCFLSMAVINYTARYDIITDIFVDICLRD